MTIDIAAARRNLQARVERERAEREARRTAAERAVVDFSTVRRVYLFVSVTRENAFRAYADMPGIGGVPPAIFFPII